MKAVNDLDINEKRHQQENWVISSPQSSEGPTIVKEWIPTGSRWLDSIAEQESRHPVGKITEIAGLSASVNLYGCCSSTLEAWSHCCVL